MDSKIKPINPTGNQPLIFIADDTILWQKAIRENSLLVQVKEESDKAGLKLNIQKKKIMASGPITSWQIYGETMEIVTDFIFGLQNHCRW